MGMSISLEGTISILSGRNALGMEAEEVVWIGEVVENSCAFIREKRLF